MDKCSSHPSPRKFLFQYMETITEVKNWSKCREHLITRSPALTDITTDSGLINDYTTKKLKSALALRASMCHIRSAVQHVLHTLPALCIPPEISIPEWEHDKTQLFREFSCIFSIGPTAQGLCSIQAFHTEPNTNWSASLVSSSSIHWISKLSWHQHPQEVASYCCTHLQNSWLSGLGTYISVKSLWVILFPLLSILGAKILYFLKVTFFCVSSPDFPGLP